MKKVELNGSLRTVQGTKGAAQLRRNKRVPCVLYGGESTIHFSVDEAPLKKIVHSPEVYRIEIDIDGQKRLARLAEKQFHPVSDSLLHVDFIEMSDSKEASVMLTLRLVGQSPGVRKGGKLSQPLRKLRVKGLPAALPEHLEFDINALEVGDSIRVRDLKFEGLAVLERPSDVVVAVKMPKKVEEAAAAAPAAGAAAAAPAKAAEAKPAAKK
ncbi:MAG: 50S ribosomal protein L25 [Flavobacteriales bacterium]|nr:50S ribosomal protein L25 [Flavobacteriales bacterium]